jgi:3-oxoacyl-[acyl-carrier protein] reductase
MTIHILANSNILHHRGIGAGIASELGRRGANVVVNYTTEKSKAAAEALVEKISTSTSKARAVAVQGNVTDSADQKKMVEAALQLSPDREINILVHNAGHGDDCYLPDITEEFYQTQTDINVKGKENPRQTP